MSNAQFTLDQLLHSTALARQIEHLHRSGHYARGACPKCGGHDRFYAGPKDNYTVFRCQQCDHYELTAKLLGLGWTATVAPAVKEYKPSAKPSVAQVLSIRDIYRSFTDFAQAQLSQSDDAIEFLAKRGLDWNADHKMMAFIQNAGSGFINAKLYRLWFGSLTDTYKRIATEWAGLPDGDKPRFSGHAAMFAGGYQGKLVFPISINREKWLTFAPALLAPKTRLTANRCAIPRPCAALLTVGSMCRAAWILSAMRRASS